MTLSALNRCVNKCVITSIHVADADLRGGTAGEDGGGKGGHAELEAAAAGGVRGLLHLLRRSAGHELRRQHAGPRGLQPWPPENAARRLRVRNPASFSNTTHRFLGVFGSDHGASWMLVTA